MSRKFEEPDFNEHGRPSDPARRTLLRAAGGLTGMIALLGLARPERAEAQKKKKTQAEVNYQSAPKGKEKCENCDLFIKPDQCASRSRVRLSPRAGARFGSPTRSRRQGQVFRRAQRGRGGNARLRYADCATQSCLNAPPMIASATFSIDCKVKPCRSGVAGALPSPIFLVRP